MPGMTGAHLRSIAIAVAFACLASPALAHTGSVSGGFVGGFAHPLFGLDHAVAMVAVGLWGAFLGAPAMFILPVVFPLVMALGGVLGIFGVALPGVEIGIAVSAAVLGMMVALAARPPLWVAVVIVGLFAIFHGHAHGAELPAGADALAYSAGFVVATGLSASVRHRLRLVGALAGGPDRSARGRRDDRDRRRDVSRAADMTPSSWAAASVVGADASDGRAGAAADRPAELGTRRAGVYAAAVLAGLGAIALAYVPTRAESACWHRQRVRACWWRWRRPLPRAMGWIVAAASRAGAGARFAAGGDLLADANLTLLGTAIGAIVVLVFLLLMISGCIAPGGIGTRIVGSWIAASAILVLALRFVR